MSYNAHTPETSELGKKTPYTSQYTPSLLFPIPREPRRTALGINQNLPFYGMDYWNHYEVSWLNNQGKPNVAIAEIIYGCESPYIIESKSMKLYFNSLNNTQFTSKDLVEKTIQHDLATYLETTNISVRIIPLYEYTATIIQKHIHGINIDNIDVPCSTYNIDPTLLTIEAPNVSEILCSDLVRSNCPVTNQPDWCSVQITYTGQQINHANLLRYLVSFRNDNEFHEQCIEKIFMHILKYCKPSKLTVYGRSTRRGGIDINSYRSTQAINPQDILNVRLCRQ